MMRHCSLQRCPRRSPQRCPQRSNDRRRRAPAQFGSESGSSLVEIALLLPVFLLVLLGAVDFGRAYYLKIEVSDAAHSGALYGSQNPTDTTGMQNAAAAAAPDVPGFTATAAYGCECSDGSSAIANCSSTPSCTTNVVDYVVVTTSAAYSALFPYPGIPSPLTLNGSARMRAGP